MNIFCPLIFVVLSSLFFHYIFPLSTKNVFCRWSFDILFHQWKECSFSNFWKQNMESNSMNSPTKSFFSFPFFLQIVYIYYRQLPITYQSTIWKISHTYPFKQGSILYTFHYTKLHNYTSYGACVAWIQISKYLHIWIALGNDLINISFNEYSYIFQMLSSGRYTLSGSLSQQHGA